MIYLIICWGADIQDEIVLLRDSRRQIAVDFSYDVLNHSSQVTRFIKKRCEFNCYFVGIFVAALKILENYRLLVFNHFSNVFQSKQSLNVRIKINMYYPRTHIIDYRWCDILSHLCYERRELDSALAWLSTLGGAFSSLGDHFETCAVMAGRISVQQFKLALRLGDPQTLARCRLFYALSLIQRGRLKFARNVIKAVHHEAVTIYAADKRLKRMCEGIWTKLQYQWRIKYKRRKPVMLT